MRLNNADQQPRCPYETFLREITRYRMAVINRTHGQATETALTLTKDSFERRVEQLMGNLATAFGGVQSLSFEASDDDASETVHELWHISNAISEVLNFFGTEPKPGEAPEMEFEVIADRIDRREVVA